MNSVILHLILPVLFVSLLCWLPTGTPRSRQEIAAQVRAEYRQHSHETDMQRARFFLQEGERQLKTVLALVATTGPSGFDPYNMHQQPIAASKSTVVSRASNDEATEFDTQSQGRLGVEWPWER